MSARTAPRRLIAGELVRLRKLDSGDDWCYGTVALVSPEGRAVAIKLDGVVRSGDGFITGVLPLIVDEARGGIFGLNDDEYELEVKAQVTRPRPPRPRSATRARATS